MMIRYYYNGPVLCVSDNLTLLSVTLSVLSDCGLYRDRGQGFNYNTVSKKSIMFTMVEVCHPPTSQDDI